MRMTSLFLAFAAAVMAEDQTTTIGYYYPLAFNSVSSYGLESTAASLKEINAMATTYEVSCQKGAPKSDCNIDKPLTVIAGENTYSIAGEYTRAATGDDAVTATTDLACSFSSSSEGASCSISYAATGTLNGAEYSYSTSDSSEDIPTNSATIYGMMVTGGVDKFDSPEATETPDAAVAFNVQGPMVTAAPLGAAAAVALAAMF